MRGAAFMGDSTLEFIDVPDPAPGPRDVVLEMKASGFCGSDLKLYRAPFQAAFAALGLKSSDGPVIAGHEPCGVIAVIGSDVDPRLFRVGARVMVHHYRGCEVCPHCRGGWTQMCCDGADIYGVNAHGGHASHMVVPANTLISLPDEVSFAAGAAMACGTGTAFGALVRLNLTARDTVAVIGQGPVGLSATMIAAAMGARVIAVDISAERVARASALGATHAIDSSAEDPVEAIRALTKGNGVTRALDTSGVQAGRSAAVRATAPWGMVCFVGEGGTVTLDVSPEIIRKQLTLAGSWTFSTNGLADCAAFVADHGLPLDELFTARWSLDQAVEAYREFDAQSSGKAVFLM